MKKIFIAIALLLIIHLTLARPQIIGYYTNWSTYSGYQPSDIPAAEIDKILYSFAQVGSCAAPYATDNNPRLCNKNERNGLTGVQDWKLHLTDPWSDLPDNGGKGNIRKTLALKKPVLYSIGGYTLSAPIRIAIEPDKVNYFVASTMDLLVKAQGGANAPYKFSGIDVDWEPNDNSWTVNNGPGKLTKSDLDNFLVYLQKLKAALTTFKEGLMIEDDTLTIAIAANPTVLADVSKVYGAHYWEKVAKVVDNIGLMSYDFHGANFPDDIRYGYTNFNSPLYYDEKQPLCNIVQICPFRELFNTQAAVLQIMKYENVPNNKIIIGVPTYGRAYALDNIQDITKDNPYAKYATHQRINGPRNDGTFTNREILTGFTYNPETGKFDKPTKANFANKYQSYNAGQAYASGYANNFTLPAFITYDNFISAQNKMLFVKTNNLAGVMVWSLDGDLNVQDSSVVRGLNSGR